MICIVSGTIHHYRRRRIIIIITIIIIIIMIGSIILVRIGDDTGNTRFTNVEYLDIGPNVGGQAIGFE